MSVSEFFGGLMKRFSAISAAVLMSSLLAQPAFATNGMNLIGYGACSALLAGGRMGNVNPTAMVGNPAMMADINQPMLCTSLTMLMPSLTYTDYSPMDGSVMNNAVDGESSVFPLPYLGYAKPLNDRMVVGVCGYAQGGMGVDFQDLNTVFGTQDDLYSNVAYMRLTGGFGYKANDRTNIGLSLSLGYAMLEFDYFPNTVAPDWNMDGMPDFIGMSATDLTSFGYNARIGFSTRTIDNRLTWGAWFGTKADVAFDGGTLTFATDLPMGNDFDLEFKDFSWPTEVGAGFAYKVNSRWHLLGDINYLGWGDAVYEPFMKTDNDMVNGMLPKFKMHWSDRTAVSVGTKYWINQDLVLLAGYNHSQNPVPANFLNGLFPATVEDHYTMGLKYVMGEWALMGGLEFVPEVSQQNPAPYDSSDYFGMTQAEIDHSQLSIHLGFSKNF
jgi:long-chain fatty acid transport protein